MQEYEWWSHPKDADPQVQSRDGLFERVLFSPFVGIHAHH
jgi:hypothetical protein